MYVHVHTYIHMHTYVHTYTHKAEALLKDDEVEEERRKRNKEASQQRRLAHCEYGDAEKTDADGFTPSQRQHLNRLIHASKVLNPTLNLEPETRN
jgi:hypothetical protein